METVVVAGSCTLWVKQGRVLSYYRGSDLEQHSRERGCCRGTNKELWSGSCGGKKEVRKVDLSSCQRPVTCMNYTR